MREKDLRARMAETMTEKEERFETNRRRARANESSFFMFGFSMRTCSSRQADDDYYGRGYWDN